jgi:hypothetical protein
MPCIPPKIGDLHHVGIVVGKIIVSCGVENILNRCSEIIAVID